MNEQESQGGLSGRQVPIKVRPIPLSQIAAVSIQIGLAQGFYKSAHMAVGVAAIAGLQHVINMPAGALPFAASLAGGMAVAKIVREVAAPWLGFNYLNEHLVLMSELNNLALKDPSLLNKPVPLTKTGTNLSLADYIDAFKKDPMVTFPEAFAQLKQIRTWARAAQGLGVNENNSDTFNP